MSDIGARVPPHDLEAEAAVLSAILLERDALDRVADTITGGAFYSEAHRRIFEAAVELSAAGSPVDVVTVAGWLRTRDRLAQVGGSTYLAQIVDAVPSVAHVEAYAETIAEKARLRALISTCQRIAADAYLAPGDTAAFMARAERAVAEIVHSGTATRYTTIGAEVRDAFTEITEAAARGDAIVGVPTGFARLDAMTAGLHDGDLTIIASRPGMGKTTLALNIAANIAAIRKQDDPGFRLGAVVHSLEMPSRQLAKRWSASESRVNVAALREPTKLKEGDWAALTEGTSRLYPLPIWIDDAPGLSVPELRAKVRRLQLEYDQPATAESLGRRIGLLIIDYLQLMRGTARASNREQEIAEISRGLKALAKELKLPVIALSQLNRSVETRGTNNKRPQLSDLRESGAIEQDADNIIFIYRDDYYDPDSKERGIAELIVAKQRNGPTGVVRVRFDAASTRFDNLARDGWGGDHAE